MRIFLSYLQKKKKREKKRKRKEKKSSKCDDIVIKQMLNYLIYLLIAFCFAGTAIVFRIKSNIYWLNFLTLLLLLVLLVSVKKRAISQCGVRWCIEKQGEEREHQRDLESVKMNAIARARKQNEKTGHLLFIRVLWYPIIDVNIIHFKFILYYIFSKCT